MRLIDIFRTGNNLQAWLHDGQGNFFRECFFEPEIFVYASLRDLCFLKKLLGSYGHACALQRRKTLKGEKTVLAVKTGIRCFSHLIKDIELLGNYSFELFNSDIPLPEYFMFSNGLFPGCIVDSSIKPLDSPYDEYEIPSLKSIVLGVETSHSLWKRYPPKLLSVILDGENYDVEGFVEKFRKEDPDILITEEGSIEIPFLLGKLRELFPDFSFSRFGKDSFAVKSNSYFSYGRTIFKSSGIYLKGRLHFEKKGVIYGKWSLVHDFEMARVCRTSLQRINHRSAGHGISNLQLYYAMKKGFLIPQKTSCSERWKSGYELFNADRGSLIYEPEIGFHDSVAEIDFVSLFPSIMVKKNISTETLFCRCCRNNRVPALDINICLNERGIIPEMLEPLIAQRMKYKSSGKKHHLERADAIKSLLVTSFGYMGFRKSKFARIESHQSIQAYARETLLAASNIAEEMGFSVVHGIIDSLWIKKKNITQEMVNELIDEIYLQTGFKAKLEGIYRWIVFLPSTANRNVPVTTRYYGVFDNREIKIRGLEARRHDTPVIIADLQRHIIESLADAHNYSEFKAAMIESVVNVRETIERILSGTVNQDELVISKSISKSEYKSRIPQSVIVSKLKRRDLEPQPGQYIKYVIVNKRSSIKENRYGFDGFDREEYARLARKAVNNLFLPFVEVQPTLFEVWNAHKRIKVEGLSLQVKERAF